MGYTHTVSDSLYMITHFVAVSTNFRLDFTQPSDIFSGMDSRDKFGPRLTALCKEHGISASALSLKAGLGVNTIRHLQRGLRHPQPETIDTIANALNLSPADRAALRHAAGYEVDEAYTHEARQLRRDNWLPLVFVYTNNYLLPRLELDAELARRDRAAQRDAELLRAAAAAPDIVAWCTENQYRPAPSRRLLNRLEETFREALPADIDNLKSNLERAIADRKNGVSHAWNQRWAIAGVLRSHRRPPISDLELNVLFDYYTYDLDFAVCLFPLLYWNTARVRPFESVALPYARRDLAAQRRLFDAIRNGLTLEDFSLALLGKGPLGEDICRKPPSRPIIYEASFREWFQSSMRSLRVNSDPSFEQPAAYAVFDHLDFSEFLARFPIIVIDRETFASIARAASTPLWDSWVDFVRRWSTPRPDAEPMFRPDAPPLTPQRFASMFCPRIVQGGAHPDTLDSFTDRSIARTLYEASARNIDRRDWNRVAAAAENLGIGREWLKLLGILSDRSPAPPGQTEATPSKPTADPSASA